MVLKLEIYSNFIFHTHIHRHSSKRLPSINKNATSSVHISSLHLIVLGVRFKFRGKMCFTTIFIYKQTANKWAGKDK